MRCVRDWTALPTEMLEHIANRLPLTEDFNAFRGVCTCWRAVDVRCAPVSKVPLLMLAENEGSNEREFYSLAKRRICMRIPLPETMGKKCINAGFGWILTIAASGDVCLLKLFSPATTVIQLPNIQTHPRYGGRGVFSFIRGALLTADPSQTSDFKVIVATFGYLGFWRSSSETWTGMETEGISAGNAYSKELGEWYTLDIHKQVSIWDPQGSDLTKPQGQVKVDRVPDRTSVAWQYYLAKSTGGDLLMIVRNNTSRNSETIGADHFGVKRVDLVKGECRRINGLGNDAVFLGDHAAVCVDATEFPGVLKPNCIYFMDDCVNAFCPRGGGKDMGIYHIQDRSIARFGVESLSRISPPLWVFP